MSSNIILCDEYCPVCGSRMTLDLECHGDFYETDMDMRRLRTCSNKNCGVQSPPVKGMDPMYLSKRKRNRALIRLAERYNLGFREVKEESKELETNNIRVFAKGISTIFNIPLVESIKLTN